MVSRQKIKFEVGAEISDKRLYEIGEEYSQRCQYSPEPIDDINLQGLDYILFLDRQEFNNINAQIDRLYNAIKEIGLHYKEIRDYRDGLLADMEKSVNRQEEVQ